MRRSQTLLRACCTALTFAFAAPAAAQGTQPPRPVLDIGDPNDPQAYYQYGMQRIAKNPAAAADAFFWASRLDPSWADPVYARRAALILATPRLRDAVVTGDERVLDSDEMRRVDSLQLRAYQMNPFLHTRFDAELLRGYFIARYASGDRPMEVYDEGPQTDRGDVDRWLSRVLEGSHPEVRAWYAYSIGRFPEAARLYTASLGRSRNKGYTHAAIARSHFHAGDRAAALAQIQRAVAEFAKRDDRSLVRFYESKAVYEHAAGLLHELANRPDSAKAAYGRALTEDLAYWSAHRQLGLLALAQGDTATALAELDQAVQLAPGDAALRYTYGRALIEAGRYEEALTQLKQSAALAPEYAAPYFLLARVHDAAELSEQAVAYYTDFVARARQRDPGLPLARQRLTVLAAAPAPAPAPAKP